MNNILKLLFYIEQKSLPHVLKTYINVTLPPT